ncbi:MAG: hypothetical protein Q8P28_02265 [Deltaproteobacteria bacterium]|nr:hypothetical protein [Deltaproteobacteria bacterium]
MDTQVSTKIIELAKREYKRYNDSYFTEKLIEEEGIEISRERKPQAGMMHLVTNILTELLDGFILRFNRRTSAHRGKLFFAVSATVCGSGTCSLCMSNKRRPGRLIQKHKRLGYVLSSAYPISLYFDTV